MLSSTMITMSIPRPINAQETIPHQFMDFCVCTSTPDAMRLFASLTALTGGNEIVEEDTSETPQNAPSSLLESSDEEREDTWEDTNFFLGALEEDVRDEVTAEDDTDEGTDAVAGTAEETSCLGGVLLGGAEDTCSGELLGTEGVSPAFA